MNTRIADPGSARLAGVDLHALAAREGTPLYAYDAHALDARIDALRDGLHGRRARVCYAVKANSNRALLARIAAAGLGADIVSEGELRRALAAGFRASDIVFSGVGKTRMEIAAALEAGVGRFNAESREELGLLDALAAERGQVACVALRINPDVDALTHAKISTGKAENKFGIALDPARAIFREATRWPALRIDGLHAHIGSQLLSLDPIREAMARVAVFAGELRASGTALRSIDVGGGLGVCYREGQDHPPALSDYLATVFAAFDGFEGELVFEPGRWLVAEAGYLLARVVRVKQGSSRCFLVLDAAMNDLIRPSLYEAWHDIVSLVPQDRPMRVYDVVGPVCETGDTFARDRALAEVEEGDLVVLCGAGAYGMSMASTYNSRPLPAEVLLESGGYQLIRMRQTWEEMTAGECAPLERGTA